MAHNVPPALRPPGPFRVGKFLVVPDRKLISEWKGSVRVSDRKAQHLPDKALGVLLWLSRSAGKVCERDELLDAVWGPDRDAYDRVLDNAIREIRRALGDSARSPDYIETIPKRGYRLIAEVEWLDVEAGGAPHPPPPSAARPAAAVSAREHAADRALERGLLVFQMLLFCFLAALGISAYQWWQAPVNALLISVGTFDMSPADLTFRLEDQLIDGLGSSEMCSGSVYYRFRRIGLLAGVRLTGGMQRHGDWLALDAELQGLPSGAGGRVETVRGPAGAGPGPLIHELVQRIHHRIDREICDFGPLDPKQACHCYQAGERFRNERRYKDALRYLTRARMADSEHLGAVDALANVYHIVGRDEEARQLLIRGLDQEGSSRKERLILERRLAQVDEDYHAQERLLNDLRDLEPHEPDWSLALGWFLRTHHRKCRSSLELYRDAIASAPARSHFYAYLGEAELECGDPRAAVEAFETYVELEPLSPDAYDGLASVLRGTGRRQEAADALRMGLGLDGAYAPSYLQRAQLYFSQGNYREAARNYKRYGAMTWPSARCRAEIGLGRIALRLGRWQEAVTHAGQALEQQEDAVEAWWILGMVAVEQGRPRRAAQIAERIREFREARSTLWQMEHYHHLLGRVHLLEGRTMEAIRAFRRAVDLHPAEPALFRSALAGAFSEIGKHDKALEQYEQLLATDPRHPDTLCALARLKLKGGDPVEAKEALRRMDEVWDDATPDPHARSCRRLLLELELGVSSAG